jgi:hypothetical protein
MEVAQTPILNKRPRARQVLPTRCLSCKSAQGYQRVAVTGAVTIKDESFELAYEAMVCPNCQHQILTDDQVEQRMRLVVAVYQEHHDLLTAQEVSGQRKALGFPTQQEFVDAAAPLSIATLKRLEAGQHIQDATTDFVLRKAFEALEKRRRSLDICKLLHAPMPEPVEIEYSSPAPTHSWLLNYASWPIAACVTFLASTSMSRADRAEAESLKVPVAEISSPC